MPTIGMSSKSWMPPRCSRDSATWLALYLSCTCVVEVLPDTPAALSERTAASRTPVGGRRQQLVHPRLGVAFLVLGDSGADHVAGHGSVDEDDELVELGDAHAAEGEAGHREVDEFIALESKSWGSHAASIRRESSRQTHSAGARG